MKKRERHNSQNTLSFDESINGWVSFYSYKPTLINSLKNSFYTVDDYSLYQHYVDTNNGLNFETFYGVSVPANITIIFNENPSIMKNFQTVGYEGSNGWQVDSFISDATEQLLLTNIGSYYPAQDTISKVLSLQEGTYTDPLTQYPAYAGLHLKENKYVSNLINNSTAVEGEVVWGQSMSGIKGHFSTVTLSTDNSTQVGGMKELFAVSSKFVISSK